MLTGVEGAEPQSFLPTIKEVDEEGDEEGDEESASVCNAGGLDGFAAEGGDPGADSRGHATGTETRQQAVDSLEMEEWRKARRKWRCMVARPKGNLVIGTKMLYKTNIR